ncbi:MAG: hypothetical protein ACFFDI_16400 [Promethearchaeota archaeon]
MSLEMEKDTPIAMSRWLSLLQFPDDTRVNFSKRGRLFIFQSPESPSPLISRVTWSRYRSNTEMTVPLSTVRSLLKTPKDLFVASYTVTSIGSLKSQMSIRLPIKLEGSPLPRLLALMCLVKGIFKTGLFMSSEEEKTQAFEDTFREIFGVSLDVGSNARGNYINITVQLTQAIIHAFTGSPTSGPIECINSLLNTSEDAILLFLRTWFSYARITRSPNDRTIFSFRSNDETQEIVKLLDKVGVTYEIGSITENDVTIPVYLVKNTIDNKAILYSDLSPDEYSKKELLEEIARLKIKISMADEKIANLEEIIEDLKSKLGEVSRKKTRVAYSRYYYERKAAKLQTQLSELEQLRDDLVLENESLKRLLKEHEGTQKDKEVGLPEKPLEIQELLKKIQDLEKRLDDRTETSVILRKEIELRGMSRDQTSDLDKPTEIITTSPILRILMQSFLSVPENWLLLYLSTEKSKSQQTLMELMDANTPEEKMNIRRWLAGFEEKGVIVHDSSDGTYTINPGKFNLTWNKLIPKNISQLPFDLRQLFAQLRQFKSRSKKPEERVKIPFS